MILQLLYNVLFFTAPLIMTSMTSELFEFNKMLFIYILTVCVLFVWVAKMILNKRIILKKTPFDIPLLLFLGSQILSTLFSIDRHTSLYGYYGRFNGGLISIIAFTILYFAFTANFFSVNDGLMYIKKFFKVSLLGSFTVILWGLPGKFGYDLSCLLFTGQWNNSCWTDQFHPSERMFSTLGQPNWLGAYLTINFFIGIYFLMTDYLKKTEKKVSAATIVILGYLFLNFSSILFTRSRSALVSVLIGLILFILFVAYYAKRAVSTVRLQKNVIIAFILLIVVLPLVLFKTTLLSLKQQKQIPQPKVQTVPSGISESFDIRKIVWKGAIDLANRYPLFGTGVETFAYSYYFVRPVAHNLTSEWDFLYNKAHNEYLNYAATTGYVGLVTYLIMIAMFIALTIRAAYEMRSRLDMVFLFGSLLVSYVSILITNFFGFSTTTINLYFYIIPAIVMSAHYVQSEEKITITPVRSISKYQKIYLGIAAFITIYFLISCINYFIADVSYAQADIYSKTGDYQKSASLLMKALKLKYEHVYEDKLSYVLANLAIVASYQKQQKLSMEFVQLAENYNTKSIAASPKNVLYWKTRAKNEYLFYQISLDKGKIMDGIKALKEAEKLSPTDPKIPYSLAVFDALLYDEEKNREQKDVYRARSLDEINTSIRLKPNYRDSYLLKGQLLKKYGMREEAKQTFEYILTTLNPSDEDVKKELQSL